jgi:hypothetical protein
MLYFSGYLIQGAKDEHEEKLAELPITKIDQDPEMDRAHLVSAGSS